MKFGLLLLLVLPPFMQLHAQETKDKVVIKSNLFNLFTKGPSLGVQVQLKNNWHLVPSYSQGQIDWGNFGITKFKSSSLEFRKQKSLTAFYYGFYLKHIVKKVTNFEGTVGTGFLSFNIGKDRNFKGDGLSGGLTTGVQGFIAKRINLDLNFMIGGGRYYKMKETFIYNYPSGTFADARVALWLGYTL